MITICAKDEVHLFNNCQFTLLCISILKDLCEQYDFKLYCYCFMPDHVHFVISVQGKYSILNFVAMFKSLTSKKAKEIGYETPIYQS